MKSIRLSTNSRSSARFLHRVRSRLAGPRAQRAHGTDGTRGLSRQTRTPAMSLHEVAGAGPLRAGQDLDELVVNPVGVVGAGEPQTLGDAKHVRVHGNRRLAEGVAQHDVSRLEPDPR